MKKPIIGITLDWEDEKSYSQHCSWYALRDNYISAIINHGGVPILIPYDLSSISTYINLIDGLIIPGGDYDIDPESYNEKSNNVRVLKQNRFKFESELLQKAMGKKIPILGICAGMQLINVNFGGSLIQDIQSEYFSEINHEQKISHHKTSHLINIDSNTLLGRITGVLKTEVNSTHHQAIKTLGPGLIVSAKAPDGIIEAIEHEKYPFLIGVEWHPEYLITEEDQNIFRSFIKAST